MARIMAIAGFFGRIAWEDDEPAGFALALDLGGECEILALGVVPGRRRAGTGSALLAAICEEALRRGGHSVFLEVAADNAAARALYAARGFVQIGRRLNYYRRPAGPGRRAGAAPGDRPRLAFDLSSPSPSSVLAPRCRLQPNVTGADDAIARNGRSSAIACVPVVTYIRRSAARWDHRYEQLRPNQRFAGTDDRNRRRARFQQYSVGRVICRS